MHLLSFSSPSPGDNASAGPSSGAALAATQTLTLQDKFATAVHSRTAGQLNQSSATAQASRLAVSESGASKVLVPMPLAIAKAKRPSQVDGRSFDLRSSMVIPGRGPGVVKESESRSVHCGALLMTVRYRSDHPGATTMRSCVGCQPQFACQLRRSRLGQLHVAAAASATGTECKGPSFRRHLVRRRPTLPPDDFGRGSH